MCAAPTLPSPVPGLTAQAVHLPLLTAYLYHLVTPRLLSPEKYCSTTFLPFCSTRSYKYGIRFTKYGTTEGFRTSSLAAAQLAFFLGLRNPYRNILATKLLMKHLCYILYLLDLATCAIAFYLSSVRIGSIKGGGSRLKRRRKTSLYSLRIARNLMRPFMLKLYPLDSLKSRLKAF